MEYIIFVNEKLDITRLSRDASFQSKLRSYQTSLLALTDVLGVFTGNKSFRTPRTDIKDVPRLLKITSVRPDS